MCNNCIHKPVCAKYTATGGHVNKCEHFKEERKGKWIIQEDGYYDSDWKCSACGEVWFFSYDPTDKYTMVSHCPTCGADMRGAEDG
jgi:hypothetical protein